MKKNCFLIILIFYSLCSISQSATISSAGGSSALNSIQISWTLGESFSETMKGGNAILTAGFQQPYLPIHKTDPISNGKVRVFPNPTTSKLFLEFENLNYNHVNIQLLSASGATLLTGDYSVADGKVEIDMRRFINGIYWLKITSIDHQFYKTATIIKF